MRIAKVSAFVLSVAALCNLASPAQAFSSDESTYITFEAPVKVPGMVLPAGTYLFRLANTYSNRDLVQILNPEQTRVYATLVAIPAYRQQPEDGTIVSFQSANAPEAAIQAWFYPNTTYGHKFLYMDRPNKQRRIEVGAAALKSK
jgi:hypothetical protein